MKQITSTRAISLSLTEFEITELSKKREMPSGTQALINDALAELDQIHQAIQQQPAVKALIDATENFIYHQPQRSDNFKQYEPLLKALWDLGYRYCEGCDHIKESTKERADLPGGVALCNECDQDTRTNIEAETELIDRLQAEQQPEPIAYDQVEVDAQQREHQIEVDTIRDIADTIEQGDIEAFLENKYSDRPSRYHLSE